MKKMLSTLFVCLITICMGVFLYGCDSNFTINITQEGLSADLYSIELSKEGSAFTMANSYNVNKDDNLRVEISANGKGVDFSNLKVVINNQEQEVFKYSSYDCFGDNLKYGYFLLPKVNEDKNISFSGVDTLSSQFNFSIINIEDAQVLEKAQMMQVSVGGEYQSIITLLESSQGNIAKTYTDENKEDFYSFKVKFEGVNPFNIAAEEFISLQADGQAKDVEMTQLEDEYLFNIENLEQVKQINIAFNFEQLTYKNFKIVLPTDNLTYKVSCDKAEISYDQTATITLQKLSAEADYSNVKVYANEFELTKGEETESEIKFIFPAEITAQGQNAYQIKVDGIEYSVDTFVQTFIVDNVDESANFAEISLAEIDDEGVVKGISSIDKDGNFLAFKEKKYLLSWNYLYDDNFNVYKSAFDLQNYSVFVGDEKLFSLNEILADKNENVEQLIAGKYTFKAIYNEQTQMFDQFSLQYVCESQTNFVFADLIVLEKNIALSYSFDDERIEEVEVLVENGLDANWNKLIKDQILSIDVQSGTKITFKLKSNMNVSTTIFDFIDNGVCENVEKSIYFERQSYYLIISCEISDLQFEVNSVTLEKTV